MTFPCNKLEFCFNLLYLESDENNKGPKNNEKVMIHLFFQNVNIRD